MRRIAADRLEICVEAIEDDSSPEEAGEGNPGFAKTVREVMAKNCDEWNWCTARITVRIAGMYNSPFGVAYLGQCCYNNKQDFIDNSGYYEDKVEEATEEFHQKMEKQLQGLRELGIFGDHAELIEELESLADGEDDPLGFLLMRAAKALKFEYEETPVKG
jgi:hypothetical protein